MKTKNPYLTQKCRMAAGLLLAIVSFQSLNAAQGPQPNICTRGCWGARAPKSTPGQMSSLTRAIIHHTAGASDYTTSYETGKVKVRGVQNIHMDANGWSDIGYHFVVNAAGHIYEGRSGSMSSLPQGAHDGANVNSFGFTCLGNFADFSESGGANQQPPSAMLGSLYDVIAWRMPSAWSPYGSGSYNGKTVGTLDGHRKVKATACPGNNIHNVHITSNYSGGNARNGVNARKAGVPQITAGADVSSRGDGKLDVFVRGADNALWTRSYDASAGGWGGWQSLGGTITSDPAAVSWSSTRIDVFARGLDGAIHSRNWNASSGWSGWYSIGGGSIGGPDVASCRPDHLDVHIRGQDNALWHKWWNGTAWSDWETLGGSIKSDPSVVAWSSTRVDVFATGLDNAIHSRNWNESSGWGGWYSIGGAAIGSPTVASWGPDRLDVFIRGVDNALWHKWWNGTTWGGWDPLGGSITSDSGAVSWGPNRIDVFARGTDSTFWSIGWNSSSWTPWYSIGGN